MNERAIYASHHQGRCDYRRFCLTHESRLGDNSRDSIQAHVRARRLDDRNCRFEMRCMAGEAAR
jgi:hypothetical protein